MKQSNWSKFAFTILGAGVLLVILSVGPLSAVSQDVGVLGHPKIDKQPIYAFVQTTTPGKKLPDPTIGPGKTKMTCLPGATNLSSQIGSQQHQNSPNPVKFTSASNTYGQNNPCYPGYLQVEATDTSGLNVYMVGHWGDAKGDPHPTTKSSCKVTRVEVIFLGYKDNNWENLGSISGPGTWDDSTLKCNTPVAGRIFNDSPYSKMRVLTKAWLATNYLPKKKVTGYLQNLKW